MCRFSAIALILTVSLVVMNSPAVAADKNLLPADGEFENVVITGNFSADFIDAGWDFGNHEQPNAAPDTAYPSPGDGHGVDTNNQCPTSDKAFHFDLGFPTLSSVVGTRVADIKLNDEFDPNTAPNPNPPGIQLPNSDPHFYLDEIFIEDLQPLGTLNSAHAGIFIDLFSNGNWVGSVRLYWGNQSGYNTSIRNDGPGGGEVKYLTFSATSPEAVTFDPTMNDVGVCLGPYKYDIPALMEAQFPTGTPGQRWADMNVTACKINIQCWTSNADPHHISGWMDGLELLDGPRSLFDSPVAVSPLDSATDVEADGDLVWTSDPTVDEHKVYFGPAGGPLTLRSTQATGNETYNPHADAGVTMAWGTGYEWRIDECEGGQTVVTGDTWSFTTHELQCTLAADIDGSGDCIVDLNDFATLAGEWLMMCQYDRAILLPCP